MDVEGFSTSHDYILCYVKGSIESVKRESFQQNKSQFNFVDPTTGKNYRRRSVRKEGSHSTRSERPNLYFALEAPDGTELYPIKPDGTEGCWRWSMNTYIENLNNDLVEWVNTDIGWQVYAKQFLDDNAAKPPETLWLHNEVGHNHSAAEELKKMIEGKYFDSPKPKELIIKMLKIATDDDSLILDFFAGSGTTAHAVMQLNKEDGGNRQYIMVQLPELTDEKSEAYKAGYKSIGEICKERIRRAGAKLRETDNQMTLSEDRPPLDTGFKVFKLDSSNIKFWDGTPVGVGNGQLYLDNMRKVIDGVKDDRPPLDVVYELMLKLGIPLTCEIVEKEIMGKTVYSVDGDLLLFCLAPSITTELVEAMTELAPAKMIFAEMGLADDTAMANAHYILQDRGIEIKLV